MRTAPSTGRAPLVVAGMHRSGTSLLASLVAGAGVAMGPRLMGASRGNLRGHFEDLDFYELHAESLRANGVGTEGFGCPATLTVPPAFREAAAALVATRIAAGVPWGWKDPRTCLFLDFWAELLPEARFVFVFRSPWEVMDSLFRRGDEIFVTNPAHAARVWLAYNRRILRFHRRHPSRSLLVEVGQVANDPATVFAAIRSRLGVALDAPPAVFEPPLLTRDHGAARRALLGDFLAGAIRLHDELRRAACLPVAGNDLVGTIRHPIAEQAIGEWARAAVAGERARQVETELDAAISARRQAEEAAAAASGPPSAAGRAA